MAIEASPTATLAAAPTRPFLGWRMAGVSSLAQFVSTGVVLSVIGNFVVPISGDFGVAPTTIGIAPGLSILMMGIVGPFIGRALDSGHTRQLMAAGSTLTGVGLLLGAHAESLWQLALCHVLLVSVGAALFGALPSMTLVSNWFVRRQGLAIGLAVAGATLASYPFPAAAQWLIDHYDWRTAFSALGAFTLVVGVPIFGLLVIGRPESVGQQPDGDAGADDPEDASSERPAAIERAAEPIPVMAAGAIARDVRLWLAAVGFGLVFTSPIVLTALLVPYGVSLGFTPQQATVFFAAMIPFSLLGKVVIGGLADVAPLKPSIAMVVIVNVLLWALLYTEPSYPLFLACGALYGVGIGGAAPLQAVLMARLFGRANFGQASGIGGMAAIPLLVIANIGSQTFLGATGSYRLTFLVQMGALLLGGVMLAILRIPDHRGAGGAARRA